MATKGPNEPHVHHQTTDRSVVSARAAVRARAVGEANSLTASPNFGGLKQGMAPAVVAPLDRPLTRSIACSTLARSIAPFLAPPLFAGCGAI